MRSHAIILAIAAALLAAGCTLPGSTPTPSSTTSTPSTTTTTSSTPTPSTPPVNDSVTPSDYTVEVAGVPASVNASDEFSFTLFVNGTKTRATDHAGAHFGANSTNGTTTAPSTTFYDQACVHASGNVPGTFTVKCKATTPGVYYLRGHMRLNDSGNLVNFWGSEQKLVVVGNYTLQTTLSSDPTTPNTAHLNTPFTFKLWINGTGNVSSDHIGAHYNASDKSSETPTVAAYGLGACVHAGGSVPGEYTVSCTFTDPATLPSVYLRAHMRITDAAGKKYDFWSQQYQVLVAPV